MTATLATLTEALELYGQHHPECAALWPQKACDCGLSGFVDKPAPALDMHRPEPELAKLKVRPFGGDDVMPTMHRRPGMDTAPRTRVAKPATLTRACTSCKANFDQPRKKGHPLMKCEACRR